MTTATELALPCLDLLGGLLELLLGMMVAAVVVELLAFSEWLVADIAYEVRVPLWLWGAGLQILLLVSVLKRHMSISLPLWGEAPDADRARVLFRPCHLPLRVLQKTNYLTVCVIQTVVAPAFSANSQNCPHLIPAGSVFSQNCPVRLLAPVTRSSCLYLAFFVFSFLGFRCSRNRSSPLLDVSSLGSPLASGPFSSLICLARPLDCFFWWMFFQVSFLVFRFWILRII